MKEKFIKADLETLKGLYSEATDKLKQALIRGTPWKTVQRIRNKVTQLERALFNKLQSSNILDLDSL